MNIKKIIYQSNTILVNIRKKLIYQYNKILVKIREKLPPWIEIDKFLHFSVCFILSFIFGTYGVAIAILASLIKEYKDMLTPGNSWSWGDIIADGLGIIIGYSLRVLLFGF